MFHFRVFTNISVIYMFHMLPKIKIVCNILSACMLKQHHAVWTVPLGHLIGAQKASELEHFKFQVVGVRDAQPVFTKVTF